MRNSLKYPLYVIFFSLVALPLFGGIDNPYLNIIRKPGASTRNVIQPTGAAVVPLVVKGAASQSANLLEFKNSTGTTLSAFDSVGALSGAAGSAVSSVFSRTGAIVAVVNDYTWAQVNKATSSLNDITTRSLTNAAAGDVGLVLNGHASQSGDFLQVKNSVGTVLHKVDSGGFSSIRIAVVEDQKTNGTNGGEATSGSWIARVLNTISAGGTGITLASNQLTMPAGSYCVRFAVPFHGVVNRARARIYNTTDTAILLEGVSVALTSGGSTFYSHIYGCFTLAAQKVVEVQYRVQTTVATTGLGFEAGGIFTDQDHETYTTGEIIRYAP